MYHLSPAEHLRLIYQFAETNSFKNPSTKTHSESFQVVCNRMVYSLSVLEGGMSNSNVRPFHDCAPIIPTAKDWAPVFLMLVTVNFLGLLILPCTNMPSIPARPHNAPGPLSYTCHSTFLCSTLCNLLISDSRHWLKLLTGVGMVLHRKTIGKLSKMACHA